MSMFTKFVFKCLLKYHSDHLLFIVLLLKKEFAEEYRKITELEKNI